MSTAPEFLPEGTCVTVFGTDRISVGLTSEQVNILQPEDLEVIWRRNGFERQPPFSAVVGFENVFMNIRPDEPPFNCEGVPPQEPEPEPESPTCTQVELAPRGSGNVVSGRTTTIGPGEVLNLVATIANDDGRRDNIVWESFAGVLASQLWDVAEWRAPTVDGTYFLRVIVDGQRQFACDMGFEVAGGATDPDEPIVEPGTGEILAEIGEQAQRIIDRLTAERDFLAGLLAEVGVKVDAVPTAVPQHVGPLLDSQTSQIETLLGGLSFPDLGALIELVPDLKSLLDGPLDFILSRTGGVNVSPFPNDSP